MRVVRDLALLPDALAVARREAETAFGDDRLILERYLEGPRHVEIQVLFDAHGNGVHLGERDCSLQRRHQKVLEETPSPGLDPKIRARMADAALRLASAVGYRSAGTCEFLVADDGHAYFLEMNTRLQVEHPVTEAVTGRDLVADQLAIAGGARLAEIGLDQASVDRSLAKGGHAVEVRLYAEDAENGFLPATGRVEALGFPTGEGIRVDAGIAVGTEVGPRFDPLLAKIVAAGKDRKAAFARLERALDETVVLGLVTNLRFLRWLVREPAVRQGLARTETLGHIWPPDDWPNRSAVPDAAWSAAAALLAGGARTAPPSMPSPARGGSTARPSSGSRPTARSGRSPCPPPHRSPPAGRTRRRHRVHRCRRPQPGVPHRPTARRRSGRSSRGRPCPGRRSALGRSSDARRRHRCPRDRRRHGRAGSAARHARGDEDGARRRRARAGAGDRDRGSRRRPGRPRQPPRDDRRRRVTLAARRNHDDRTDEDARRPARSTMSPPASGATRPRSAARSTAPRSRRSPGSRSRSPGSSGPRRRPASDPADAHALPARPDPDE